MPDFQQICIHRSKNAALADKQKGKKASANYFYALQRVLWKIYISLSEFAGFH